MCHFRYIVYLTFIFVHILEVYSSSLYDSLKELEDLGNPNPKFKEIEATNPDLGRNSNTRCCTKKSDCKFYERCSSCNVCVNIWSFNTCKNTRQRSGLKPWPRMIPSRCQNDWECDLGERCIGGFCRFVCFPPQPWPVPPIGRK